MAKFIPDVVTRLNAACDAVADAREQYQASPSEATKANLNAAKDAQGVAHDRAMAAWEASLGPVHVYEVMEGGVPVVVVLQAASLGGGRATRVRPGDEQYEELRGRVAADMSTDRRVLIAAMDAWGVTEIGRVRIDYFGHGADQTAVVYETNKYGRAKNGGRRHSMQVA